MKAKAQFLEAGPLSPAQKRFLEALRETLGNVSAACAATGTARATHYVWRKSPAYLEALEDLEERNLDRAESALYGLIETGNVTAIIFYLKTKGRGRGYAEKVALDVGPSPVSIVIHAPDGTTLATDD